MGRLGAALNVCMQMQSLWRKCTKNKKILLVTSHLTVLNFLYKADLLLFNDLCFVTEIKTIKVQM